MKKLFAFFAVLLTAALPCARAQVPAPEADFFAGSLFAQPDAAGTDAAVFASASRVPAGGEFSLLVKISMKPGWHAYWKNPGEAGMPLDVAWEKFPAGARFGEARWSAPKFYELSGIASYVFEDVGFVEFPVSLPADVPAGNAVFAGTASWLACDDNGCYPQEKKFSASVEIVPAGGSVVPANGSVFVEAEKAFPRRAPELSGTVSENAETVALLLKNPVAAADAPQARFFPESSKFSPTAAEAVPVAENGNLLFALPLREGESLASPAEAAGVLLCGGNAFELRPESLAPAGAPESGGSDAALGGGFFGLLALAFAGGLILNLMPCVFPVLGLKIMHFVGKAGTDKKKVARHGFVFAAGVLVSFWILAGVLAVLRSGGEQLGWGFQLQEPMFVYGMILLLLVFGLSMSGVFEFGVGATGVGSSLAEKSGFAGSFFSGVLAVVVATPCAAPFLAPALGSALTLPAVPSFFLFTAIALGLAAPYVVLSCAPALLKFLPKPGAWMETFKQAMAFLLYAPALYFAWVLLGQVESASAQRDLLISFAVVALACWIYGKWAAAWRSRVSRVAGTAVALALFAGTVAYAGTLLSEKEGDAWTAWSPEAQASALDEGKIVYVDFTARWCATCQVNKRVYSDEALARELDAAGVVKMRADWTNKNPAIAAELRKYGRAAVPVNVFLKKGSAPVVLGELFSGPGTVSDGLAKILGEEEKED